MIADEKVTLYGVPIVAVRPVNYGAIDPTVSREIFIQSALVEGVGIPSINSSKKIKGSFEK